MPEVDPIARDVVIHGYVQGVFFRGTCQAEARQYGVRGWVRNEYDGTVAAHFEGDPLAVHAMTDWCRHGPRHATVQHVDVTESAVEGLSTFEVRY